jgi:DNA-binding SARP family transcriptional activator
MERINDLEGTGHPKAAALAAFGRALVADLAGDDTTALAELASIETGALDPAWGALASWLYGEVRLNTGHPQAAIDVVERLARTADPAMRYVLDTLRLRACWAQGQVDKVIAGIPAIIELSRHSGVTANRYIGLSISSLAYSHAGDVAAARRCLDESLLAAPPSRSGRLSVQSAAATASLQLAEGDEAAATATLRDAIEAHGLSDARDRRAWRYVIALSYVLLPETRPHWDALAARRQGRASADLAAAVVAWRAGNSGPLRTVRVDDIGMVRAVLHHRLAAELAVGLASVGRDEGRALLEALGPPGRTAVRSLASNGTAQPAKVAKALLAAVPAPPPRPCYLAVLGPISVRRGGPADDVLDVLDPEMRRTRVQELLAYLVGRRRTTRRAVTAALWPDLDERSASNNLGVTITHLLRVLEPGRDSGDPPYLLRTDGQTLQLVTGPHLRVDVDEFEDHLTAAAQAEADGTPSVALEHHLAAIALYRDDLHLDLPEAEWFALDRERYRTRFVTTAVRAGQLLLGRGDHRRAQDIAHRALAVDPWSEDAYAVLVGAALARGDRSAAHRTLDRCLQALGDMGIQPSPTTEQLGRRIQTL